MVRSEALMPIAMTLLTLLLGGQLCAAAPSSAAAAVTGIRPNLGLVKRKKFAAPPLSSAGGALGLEAAIGVSPWNLHRGGASDHDESVSESSDSEEEDADDGVAAPTGGAATVAGLLGGALRAVGRILSRMIRAALSPEEGEGGSGAPQSPTDGVLCGTLGDALRTARKEARLLVAYVPARKGGRAAKAKNSVAEASLQSSEVRTAADRRARKKEKGGAEGHHGSYVLWSGSEGGAAESAAALKRLRAKPPRGGGPVLLVAYAAQVLGSGGRPKLVPKILAQHHCNPPPGPEAMAAWLNALRKRHAKEYAGMQHQIREEALAEERAHGYGKSRKDDAEREEREVREAEEAAAREEAEKLRAEEMERRREELLGALPEEPPAGGPEVVTIALRFADGRTGQRRFDNSVGIDVVFNWVDAVYGIEREKIELSTMNGQKRFTYMEDGAENRALKDVGLGKMTGLRVVEIEEDTGGKKNEDGDGQ